MTDLTTKTHDELQELGVAWFKEVEHRLAAAGRTRALRIVQSAHKSLNVASGLLADEGDVQALSGGDDKD